MILLQNVIEILEVLIVVFDSQVMRSLIRSTPSDMQAGNHQPGNDVDQGRGRWIPQPSEFHCLLHYYKDDLDSLCIRSVISG